MNRGAGYRPSNRVEQLTHRRAKVDRWRSNRGVSPKSYILGDKTPLFLATGPPVERTGETTNECVTLGASLVASSSVLLNSETWVYKSYGFPPGDRDREADVG